MRFVQPQSPLLLPAFPAVVPCKSLILQNPYWCSCRFASAFQKLAGAEGFEPPSSVLETDSLTVELTPLCSRSADALVRVPLFNLFMRRMLPATAAELLLFQPLGHRLAVLGSRIVPLFAITALHRNNFSGHCSLLNFSNLSSRGVFFAPKDLCNSCSCGADTPVRVRRG